MDTLLAVPCYSDLLGDQDNEDKTERSQSLIMSRPGWRTEMAKWISEAQAAKLDDDTDNEDGTVSAEVSNTQITKWKPVPLANLFSSCESILSRPPITKIDSEAMLMEALAEVEEDERPDDGAVEVGSDEEYNGQQSAYYLEIASISLPPEWDVKL